MCTDVSLQTCIENIYLMPCVYQAFKLWTAAEGGDLEMARSLLHDKADVNSRDPTRFQPCTAMDVEVGSLAIPACCIIPNPKQPQTSECASIYHLPLRLRSQYLPSPLALPFITYVPFHSFRQYMQETALHKAARQGHAALVTLLLESGADAGARNAAHFHRVLDRTVIHITSAGLQEANGPYKMSARHGNSQRPEYRHCDNSTYSICFGPYTQHWILDKPGPAPYMIEDRFCFDFEFPYNGAWLEHQSSEPPVPQTDRMASFASPEYPTYATALHMVAQEGHLEAVRALTRRDGFEATEVNVTEPHRGRTALHLAAERGQSAVLRFLICQAGANVDAVDSDEQTPLMIAAMKGWLEAVRVLVLEGKANVDAGDGYGRTALHRAAERGHLAVVKFMVLEGKACVESCDCDKATALFHAAESGHAEVISFLILEGKANPERKHHRRDATPLLAAAMNGHSGAVRVLAVEGKANLVETDYKGRDAAELCCSCGHLQCLLELWNLGHKPDESRLPSLCDIMRQSGNLGTQAGVQWAVLSGEADQLCHAFAVPTVMGQEEAVADQVSSASAAMEAQSTLETDRPSPADAAGCGIPRRAQQQMWKAERSRLLFGEFKAGNKELKEVDDLNGYVRCHSNGMFIVVPPNSSSLTALIFIRHSSTIFGTSSAESAAEIALTASSQGDGPIAASSKDSNAEDDGTVSLYAHSVLMAQKLYLSSLDFSFNQSVVDLDLDPVLSLESLEKFVCRACPRLKSIKSARFNSSNQQALGKSRLAEIDLSNNILLEALPLPAFAALTQLKSLVCKACPQLYSPPQEICKQGGRATAEFVREVQRDGHISEYMTLFLIGDGESGKTSTMKALKSADNASERIQEDKRTVGIDISEWAPEGLEVSFRIFDLAGQAVYGKAHQYFL
jgi:ankyrin repeat protein